MSKVGALYLAGISLMVLMLLAPASRAAIIDTIQGSINHPFIVGNTTLPPGKYDFRMVQTSNGLVMRVSSVNGSHSAEFLVRSAIDSHRPRHSELVFNRYGNVEVLKKIFEQGNKTGVVVVDASREEADLQKQGQKPEQHTEEQGQ